jgi:hypothetical protein
VACCIRRRAWSATALASRIAWTWSPTTVTWPSGATSALAYPRLGSNATVPTWASPVARPGLKPAVHEGGRRVQGGWIEATIRDRAAPHPAPLP